MKKVTNQILAFFLLVVLTGCSSSDGGGGGSTAKSYSLAEGGTVRNMTAGDYAKMTGTIEAQQGSSRASYAVILEQSLANGGYTQYSSNQLILSSITIKETNNSTGTLIQNTSTDYYVKSGGVDYKVMEQGKDDLFYAVNQLNGVPSEMQKIVNDGSYSQTYTLDACSSYSFFTCVSPTTIANVTATYTLIGTETVSTSIGNFESYKIRTTLNQTSINTNVFSNFNGSSIAWYHPALGTVKQTGTMSSTDYSPTLVQEFEVTLSATNISKYSRNQSGLGLWSPLSIFKMMKPIQ